MSKEFEHACTHGDHLVCVDIAADGKSSCAACCERTCFGVETPEDFEPGDSVEREVAGYDLKPSNPKDAAGIGKAPLSAVPLHPLLEIGLGMLEGARKYGRHNYRSVGVRASVYFDAAFRHLSAFWEGEDIDRDSGLPHIIKAACCLMVLRDSQVIGNWVDDRPPSLPDGWLGELNQAAQRIVNKYQDSKEAFTRGNHADRGVSTGSK